MAFPGSIYAPPGVYTRTLFENPTQALLQGLRLPIYIGTGSEILTQEDLEVVRGSSSSVDQRIVQEDETGRAVQSVSSTGVVTLGAFNGVLDRIQVRNYPIVNGDGTGTTAINTSSVSVTINGQPIVVLRLDGTKGILKLSTPPNLGDEVRVTYYFNRTDTRTTDDVSDQVTTDAAQVFGQVGQSYEITAGVNDTFIVTVDEDGNTITITLPASNPGVPWGASQLAAFINSGASATSLLASTYTTNFGETALLLTADKDITIGNGTVNSTLGFTNGLSTGRNRVFYTFEGPIVDGSNGGITTTDPADVSVKVDGIAVTVTAVDGQNRAVTLPWAPEMGSTVSITYYFNSWQDTFDYLAHINVTDVFRCGATPDRNDYVEGADFILQDDKILWGTAVTVISGENTSGTVFFDSTQVTPLLVDSKQYLAECSPVTNGNVSPPVTSKTQWQLPLLPTTGNGRNTPLGQSLFQTVTNGRIDLPTNRPDLVIAYWGFGAQDAIERGPVTVKQVESSTSTITLADEVPVGAQVFCTFYYNTLTDQQYTLAVATPGASGVGTYTVKNEDGVALYTPLFGAKSAALTGIVIQFPSGSERTPDCRFETPFDATGFTGPVEEDVTVTFSSKDSTLGKYTVPGAGPYYPITGASDRFRLKVDGADLVLGALGINLSNIMGPGDLGFHAQMVGDEVVYEADTGFTTYTIDTTNREVNLTLDGVLVQGAAVSNAAGTLADFVAAVNNAATGETGTGQAATGVTTTMDLAATASDQNDFYVGHTIVITGGTSAGDVRTITNYVAATNRITVSAPFTLDPDATSTYLIYNAAHLPQYAGASRITSAMSVVAGAYNSFTFHYTGNVTGASGNLTATVAAGTYNSASQLAAAVQNAVNTAITAAGAGFGLTVSADSDARLVFKLNKDPLDAAGYLDFIDQVNIAATATFTVVNAPLAAGDTITLDAIPALTGVAVPRTPGANDFNATLLTPLLLAAEIVSAINDPLNAYAVFCTAVDNLDGTFTITLVGGGSLGNIVAATALTVPPGGITGPAGGTFSGGSDAGANDFAVLAGLDTDAATAGDQTKLVDGPVARRFTIAGDNTGALLYDRMVLRNRLVPGSGSMDPQSALDQATLVIEGSSAADLMGLAVNEIGVAGWKAAVLPATLVGYVGFSSGQASGYSDERDGQPVVTFFASGGTNPENNVFKFTFDGVPVTIQFRDATGAIIPSGGTADVPLGPATTAGTVIYQIAYVMAAQGLGASAAAVVAAGLVRQEGAAIRFRSALSSTVSAITIGTGNANDTLGFSDNASSAREALEPEVLVSGLMGHAAASVPGSLLTAWTAGPTATYFAAEALAKTVWDNSNAAYLFVQSQGTAGMGTSSSVSFADATLRSVLLPGVGLGVASGYGASGEAGISGYTVTSSDPVNGSGTINDSLLGSGTGQDGTVGQTYRDLVTGLTFTILPREGGTNYPDTSYFTFTVRSLVTTDSNLPVNTIPGLEMLVTNTLGIGAGDTALVETYERGGNEPAVGDLYYASYNYTKQDFSTKLFTKFAAIQAEYGTNSPDNPVTLGSYLAILNGAVLVGVKQVQKDIDEDNDGVMDSASVNAFITAVDDLEGPLPGGILPNILVPLDVPTADTVDFFAYLARHCDIQSTIRRRAERTAIAGLPAGTQPRAAGDVAQAIQRDRFRLVYPDIVTLSLTDAVGNDQEFLVDGSYLASALAGSVVQPSTDVATPWTGRKLYGFNQMSRVLDAVEQNQVAVRGVTIIEDRPPVLRVRQGLTTDMSNILRKLPMVIQIADEVQQQSRGTLDRFIGIKFLPGILSQIEGQLSNTLKLLVHAEILTAYTGVKANVAPDDPTVAEVEAYYQPVFPLLYIVVTFNLRSSL